MSFAWAYLLLSNALAQEVPWYAGELVDRVQIEAPEGGLPEETPIPLLHVTEGASLDLEAVRRDVALLYQIGHFSSVEAVAIPWLTPLDDGEMQSSVLLSYRVRMAPRVERIDIEAEHPAVRRMVRNHLTLQEGSVFYVEEDGDGIEEDLGSMLARAGWRDAMVSVTTEASARGELLVRILVDSGTLTRTGEISIAGDLVRDDSSWRERRRGGWLHSRQVRRWLWFNGVRVGRAMNIERVETGIQVVESELYSRGWRRPNAMVWYLPLAEGSDQRSMRLILGGSERLVIDAKGVGLPRGTELEEVVAYVPGMGVDEEFAEGVRERVESFMENRGYRSADVNVRLESLEGGQFLRIQARRGARSTLRRIDIDLQSTESAYLDEAPEEDWLTVRESGFSTYYIAGAMREAAPDSLGDGIVSRSGIDSALRGIEELYRGAGYLSARVEMLELEPVRARDTGEGVLFEPLVLRVRVVEGPRTILQEFSLVGDIGLLDERIESIREELLGKAYGPARLDELAREIVEIYRSEGYLFADARVRAVLSSEDLDAEVVISIEPGEQILMRSAVIQGLRRTRSRVVERELDIVSGTPITSEALVRTRAHLYELDLFRVVDLELVGEDHRSRDVFIELDERPNILVETGGGVSTDIGVLTRGRALHRNLFGLGHRFSLLGEVGYTWTRGEEWSLDLAAPVWRVGALYEAPYLPISQHSLVIEAVIRELVQESDWRLNRTGLSIGLQSRSRDWGDAWLHYRVQTRHLEDVGVGTLVAQDPWKDTLVFEDGRTDSLVLPSGSRLSMGPELFLRVDRREGLSDVDPGYLWASWVQVNHGPIASPATARVDTRLAVLRPVGPLRFAVITRLGIGWAAGGYTLPFDERFHLGGSSLRGFNLNSVGPANLAARTDIEFSETVEPVVDGVGLRTGTTHWVPTGGDSMAAMQLELRVPLSVLGLHSLDSTSIVAFTDWGHVGFLDSSIVTTSSIRELDPWFRGSVGTGFKWGTPIGPATVEVGMNLAPMAEREEPRFVWNLAIGEI